MTKITIISGFLGAGKTTFIKKLLEEAFENEKIVLIENEFGEVGIDGSFMKETGIEISELRSGCICCSLKGDFRKELSKITKTYSPDRILIEPTGLGKLSDVLSAIDDLHSEVPLDLTAAVTIVDGTRYDGYMTFFGEFYNDQIENASTIIISRTQEMEDEKIKDIVYKLRKTNPSASMITTPWYELSGNHLQDVIESENSLTQELKAEFLQENKPSDHSHDHHHDSENCHDPNCHHHSHSANEIFSDWARENLGKYDRSELESILEELANSDSLGTILRAKGIIQSLDGKWMYFDMVPGEYKITNGSPDYTGRVSVIGKDIDKEKIAELFKV